MTKWIDFSPIDTLLGAGLTFGAASKLMQALDKIPPTARLSLFDGAVRAAAELIPGMVVKPQGSKSKGVRLDAKTAAAFCEAATYHHDPGIRRALALSMAKEKWIDGMPLLGYLATDASSSVRWSALASLRKLDFPLYRVLTGNEMPLVAGIGAAGFGASFPDSGKPVDQASGGRGEHPSTSEVPARKPSDPRPAEAIRRFTDIDYSPSSERRHTGELQLALKLQAKSPSSAAVDLFVPEGREAATLIVHASSVDFGVTPDTQRIKVPRSGDSEVARFAVEAHGEATGDVALTIFDEQRLVGSLVVKMTAKVVDAAEDRRIEHERGAQSARAKAQGPQRSDRQQSDLPPGADAAGESIGRDGRALGDQGPGARRRAVGAGVPEVRQLADERAAAAGSLSGMGEREGRRADGKRRGAGLR
jgi:hypothetical protein